MKANREVEIVKCETIRLSMTPREAFLLTNLIGNMGATTKTDTINKCGYSVNPVFKCNRDITGSTTQEEVIKFEKMYEHLTKALNY